MKKDRSLFTDTRSLVSNWAVAEGPFSELRKKQVVHPSNTLLIPDFDKNLLTTHVVKKFSQVGGYEVAKSNAYKAFSEREVVNRSLNRTLRFTAPTHLRLARRYVREYLGRLDKSVLDEILTLSYFGPGVCRGSKNDELSKTRSLTITKELAPFAPALLSETGLSRLLYGNDAPFSSLSGPTVFCIDNAKLQCVPKDETKARVITIEPALNSYVQNGVGEYLRRRLERRSSRFGRPYGFNLYDQSINQSLAVYPNATLDLKDASNSLSISLVELLLPPEWFHLLDLLRSRRYIDSCGEIVPFHLFCGMGNGFCFPLQTILFASLVRAAVEEPGDCFTVYGDDIIISPNAVLPVISLYESVGLVINRDKSHYTLDDFYRESCGVHTYHGRLVTPVRFNWSQGDDLRVAAVAFHNVYLQFLSRYYFVSRESLSLCRAIQGYFPEIGIDGYGSPRISFWGNKRRRWPSSALKPVINPIPYEESACGYMHALYRKVPRHSFGAGGNMGRTVGLKAENEFFTSRQSFKGFTRVRTRSYIGLFPFVVLDAG